ncbi:folylpolyglutamate synthase/dihydrofolate synthase family protein [Oscillibacter sp.]|uniref:bifunctional folylpolyglutamate synthase/dihydrofolate synthase n=1 Tax=Oscillibacter sp. TaxID=1945593 RepID=UPI00289A9560|nr:folylpolyglutamate synthase/dihydrofolate synthase family protein [Oscillibacter sp.]
MNLSQALEFIHATSWQGSRLGLERIEELMELLGNPQKRLKFIHVAGTNGKGSVCAMLSEILTRAGYTTGLYTSPHLFRINERMKVNGTDISDEELTDLARQVKPLVDGMSDQPTEFERITAMALLYFQQKNCDVVVLEVGLGGRLDSTNVIGAPDAAVITHIALEHTDVLGDTLAKIAGEKAGIIKPGAEVVLSGQTEEVEAVVRRVCGQQGCTLRTTDSAAQTLLAHDLDGQTFDYRDRKDLRLRLIGNYQYQNAAVALDTVDVLRERRGYSISESAVREGLLAVTWPGRFEILQKNPLVLVDGAHNPDGVRELARGLEAYLPGRKLTMLMGVMADKDYDDMIRTVAPFAKEFIAVTPESERALSSEALCSRIAELTGLPARSGGDVKSGMAMAMDGKGPEDIVCAFGSLYQVGEVRAFFGRTD